MKKLLSAVVLLALASGVAWASVPDPDYCEVTPGDVMANPRIVGLPLDAGGAPYWNLNVHVAAFGGVALENAYVEVIFDVSCEGMLCYCTANSLTGYTDGNGDIAFMVQMGGCCEATAAW